MVSNFSRCLPIFQVFRLIQGEVEETRFSVLQQASEKSPDAAATWFEQEVSRQQLQETFTAQTKCSEWETAKEAYPNYSTKLEELVGKYFIFYTCNMQLKNLYSLLIIPVLILDSLTHFWADSCPAFLSCIQIFMIMFG